MKKIYTFVCCLLAGFAVNADEIDNMMQLKSLFNLDIKEVEVTSNMVIDAVVNDVAVVEKEDVKPEVIAATVASTSSLSRDELELELAVARQEVVRLRDIVKRILVANRRERAEMQYNLGCVYWHGGQNKEAAKAFLSAIEINPDDPAIHYNLGILYDDDLKMPEKALKHYKRFLELSPEDKDAGKVYEWMTALE